MRNCVPSGFLAEGSGFAAVYSLDVYSFLCFCSFEEYKEFIVSRWRVQSFNSRLFRKFQFSTAWCAARYVGLVVASSLYDVGQPQQPVEGQSAGHAAGATLLTKSKERS